MWDRIKAYLDWAFDPKYRPLEWHLWQAENGKRGGRR